MKLRYRLLWVVVLIAACVYSYRQHVNANTNTPDKSDTTSDTTVVIQMLHSEETRAWLEEAASVFKKRHPEIVVQLTSMDSLESIDAIADHRIEPLVWSPADSTDLALLKARLSSMAAERATALKDSAVTDEDLARINAALAEDTSSRVFSPETAGAPQPMLLSPLVWLGWEQPTEELRKLQAERFPTQAKLLSWAVVSEALTGQREWSEPSDGGPPRALPPLKLGFADPRRSSSGIHALYLLTLEFFGSPRPPTVEQLNNPRYRQLLKAVNAEALSQGLTNGRLLEEMLRYGPSRFDLILTSESLALNAIKTFPQDRWGKLKMSYPTYTMWNDHPVVQMATRPWNEEEMAAAQEWIAFLLSKEMQSKAIDFGFRPGNPITPLERGPGHPLEALIENGLRLDLPTSSIINEQKLPSLLELWLQPDTSSENLSENLQP